MLWLNRSLPVGWTYDVTDPLTFLGDVTERFGAVLWGPPDDTSAAGAAIGPDPVDLLPTIVTVAGHVRGVAMTAVILNHFPNTKVLIDTRGSGPRALARMLVTLEHCDSPRSVGRLRVAARLAAALARSDASNLRRR